MNSRTITLVGVVFLGLTLLVCVIGGLVLAAQKPPAGIPDFIIGTAGGCMGALAGLLVGGRVAAAGEDGGA
jgi:hypothetical protein